jgi:hypothetical protein
MKFLIRAKIPTEAGNLMVTDPNLLKNLEDHMNKVKPEAAYFFEADGNRVMAFITDMQSADQIPALAEPLFQGMGANVEFHPVMNFDELKKGLVLFQKGTFSSVIPRQQIEYQMNHSTK